jgi:hypothetical protein
MRETRLGKIGTIRREILGKACGLCGGRTYHVIFRSAVSIRGREKSEGDLYAIHSDVLLVGY